MKSFYLLSLILLFALAVKSQSRVNSYPDIKTINLYPNPATTQITFTIEDGYDKNFSLQIFNFIGKKVFESPALTPKIMIDLTNYYRGVYIFQLRDKAGKVIESGKFQVAR